jgi:hypothetical protein
MSEKKKQQRRLLSRAQFVLAGTALGLASCGGSQVSPRGLSAASTGRVGDASRETDAVATTPTPLSFGNGVTVTDNGAGSTAVIYNGTTIMSVTATSETLTAVGFGSSESISLATPTPAPTPTPTPEPTPTPTPRPSPTIKPCVGKTCLESASEEKPFAENGLHLLGYSNHHKQLVFQRGNARIIAESGADKGLKFTTYGDNGISTVWNVSPQLGMQVSVFGLPNGMRPVNVRLSKQPFAVSGPHKRQVINLGFSAKRNGRRVAQAVPVSLAGATRRQILSGSVAAADLTTIATVTTVSTVATPQPTPTLMTIVTVSTTPQPTPPPQPTPVPTSQPGGGGANPTPTPNWYTCAFNVMEALHALGGITLSSACLYWVVGGILAIPGVDAAAILAMICAAIVALALAAAVAASAYLFQNAAQEAGQNC